jgi:hypothetical protein
MTMEQWFLFVVVLSPAILFDIELPPKVEQMWEQLRKGLVYFMSYSTGQHRREQWVRARNHLLQYARMAEDFTQGGKRLCTLQLHSAVCHLVDYVELYGPSAFRAEFWVERMVQVLKRITKHRLGKKPCMTAVVHLNTVSACNAIERDCPEVAAMLNTIDNERKQEQDVAAMEDFLHFEQHEGKERDVVDGEGVQLLGNGRSAGAQEVLPVLFELESCNSNSTCQPFVRFCLKQGWVQYIYPGDKSWAPLLGSLFLGGAHHAQNSHPVVCFADQTPVAGLHTCMLTAQDTAHMYAHCTRH